MKTEHEILRIIENLREGKVVCADSDDIRTVSKSLTKQEADKLVISTFDDTDQEALIYLDK